MPFVITLVTEGIIDYAADKYQYMSTDTNYQEISISNKEVLSSILRFFECHLPKSLFLWQLLSDVTSNQISEEKLWPHRLFINDFNDLRCVVFIYSTIGFQSDYSREQEEKNFTQIYVTCFSLSEADPITLSIIEKQIPWFHCKKICFFGNDHRLSPLIMNLIEEKKLGRFKTEEFFMMELQKDQFLSNLREETSRLPADIIIQRLTHADAETVNNAWPHRSAISLAQITYEIEHFQAFGAFRNGILVSWCLRKFDGTIGTVQTNTEVRRLGLASELMRRLASELFQSQTKVICFVHRNNDASLKMVEKLGYRRICMFDWIPKDLSTNN